MNPTVATTPRELRELIAHGGWAKPTAGVLDDYQQANLVVVPQACAYEFLLFCVRNPKSCPVLAVTEPGNPVLCRGQSAIDLRTMLPRYRVWQHGELVDEPLDLTPHWRDDAVGFLLGCSHTFDAPLRRAGIAVATTAPAVYITDRPCFPAGRMAGPLVVSMRPVAAAQVPQAVQITSRYPSGHGAPVHIGDPAVLGITDLQRPAFGVVPHLPDDAVPVFWACGVTPQMALPGLRAPYAFTHYPGHMLVLDEQVDYFSGLLV